MKKILLASTILAASAGVAAAEVTISGTARMGVTYAEDFANADTNELAFSSRIRIVFTASGETDGGLAFGGSIRADNAAGGNAGTAGTFFISGAFGKLTMGDVAGAAEFVVGDLAVVGFSELGNHNENFFLSNSGAAQRSAARYEYTTGGLTFAVSADNPGGNGENANYGALLGGTVADGIAAPILAGLPADATAAEIAAALAEEGVTLPAPAARQFFGVATGEAFNVPAESTFALGVKYAAEGYAVSLGYERTKFADVNLTVGHVVAGAEATFSGVTLKATYGRASKIDFTQYGVSASYTMDALTVAGYHRQERLGDAAEEVKFTATGIGASYDLGGGAKVVGGIAQRKVGPAGGPSIKQNLADLGVTFTF